MARTESRKGGTIMAEAQSKETKGRITTTTSAAKMQEEADALLVRDPLMACALLDRDAQHLSATSSNALLRFRVTTALKDPELPALE